VHVKPFVEPRPLDEAPALLAAQARGEHFEKRVVLVPEMVSQS